jgi:Helix-turn-helix domain
MSIQAVAWALEQDIPARPKLVLVALANHADHVDGYCWLRAETIANEGACQVRSVPRFVDALVHHGYVKKQQRRGDDGRQRANDYWLLFAENKIPWSAKRRSDGEDGDYTTDCGPTDSQSGGDESAIRAENGAGSAPESVRPTDSGVSHKNIEEPSKTNLKHRALTTAALRSYEPKIQPIGGGWYDRRSREARAIGVLCHIVAQEHYFYDVMGGRESICYSQAITPQLLVLATAPPRSEWGIITERRQVAAWFNFAVEHLPMLRIKLGAPCKVPWPWPPRKSGVAYDGINALEDENCAEIKANVG